MPDANGYGPGRGKAKSVISGTNEQGGGAAYGGRGYDADSGYSLAYSSADLTNHLLGGSGGGGGDLYPGGAGGGAIELLAHGDGVLALSGSIKANGGDASRAHAESGGGGSGGAIRLEGGTVSISGTLEVKGGNGLTATPGGGGRIAIKTNGNLTLGTIALDGYRPGTLHISGTTSTNSINYSSDTLTFDTTHGYWHHSSGAHGTGVIEDKDDNGITYKTCTFTFDSINLASGLTVVLQGKNALILKTRNHGNISVGTTLSADGGNSDSSYTSYIGEVPFGMGKLGGHDGGLKNSNSNGNGAGTGGGKFQGGGVTGNIVGGGGGYGTSGQYSLNDTNFGKQYGSTALAHLLGGSGGGASTNTGGGAGGGAISLEADGNGTLTISSGATISANGGGVSSTQANGGGGGSGGSIRLAGKSITNHGQIEAKGGTPPSTASNFDGGIGGGGRISFSTSANLYEGNVDVGSGVYQGTIGHNTPPTISSALTASVAYSNTNYQKRSTTRYNNLVIWYPFDEADGTVAIDYSSNERNATLKNMSAANRIAGKLGGAISFDTPSSKLSSDASGQYLDLGSWSFGGAFTLSTWIKHDQWRSHGTIFNLPGSDSLQLRYNSTSSNNLYLLLNGTSGGNESINSGAGLLDWEKWYHLAISLENGGTNNSTARIYKDGSLFSTVTGLTVPDVVSRSNQFIARSNTGTDHYFVGDLDDFRLYGTALSATDISAIFTERSAGVHYKATALNSPTGFSASGLPSGLSVNPDTGEISGHTTAIGDHNVTIIASNLSGSDSKVITLTVNPTTPLLQSGFYEPNGMSLWLDAADLTTAGNTWSDLSGNNNHATKNGSPAVVTNAQNGKSLMRYSGDGQYHTFASSITDIRTVFWVVSQDTSANGTGFRYLLCDPSSADFHNDGNGKFWGNYAAANVKNGSTRMNGTTLSGDTNYPNDLSIISLQTAGNVSAGRFGQDRHFSGRQWIGKLGELIIYNSELSPSEIEKIEGYLAHKWGLTGALADNHAYKANSISQPVVTVDSVGSTSGTASVKILETGGADVTIDYYYGSSDKGETTIGWDFSGTLGTQSAGTSTVALNGLSASNQYVFRIKTSNSAGTVWTNATVFATNSQAQAPSIAALDASSVAGTTATANGDLLSFDGSDQPTVNLQYVEKSVGWESIVSTANLGTKAVGTFTHNLTGLTAGTAYEYLFSATNNGGTAYSGKKSFTTLGPPAVETTAASEITKTSAKLNANLTFANGSDTSITFYWNTSDGGTNASTWTAGSGGSHTLSGTHGIGSLSHTLSGLTTGTTYYYTVKAVNPQGTVWGTTKTFVPANTALNQYSIPDLVLWLDASDIDGDSQADSITSAVSVSSWTDKSASGIGVSQSNPDLQPSQLGNQFGSKPAVRFDGAGDVLNLGSIRTSSGGYSVYALVKRESESGDDNAHLISESTWSLIPSTSKDAFSAKVVKSSSASGKTLTNIKLGRSPNSTTNHFGGDLGELLIFSRELNSSEEQKIEGYLAHRWGATDSLDSNHSYKTVAPVFDNKPLIRDVSEFSNSSITNISGMQVWFDASDLNADGTTDSTASGNISSWSDKSGKGHHAPSANGTPYLNATGGPSSGRAIEIRPGDYLPVSGSFFAKDHFVVLRSPTANTTWSYYGGPFGWNGASNSDARASNYFFHHGQTTIFSDQYPENAWKNGSAVSGWNLSPITSWMILRAVVNDNNTGPHNSYQIGRVTLFQCNLDIAEIIAFDSKISNADAAL